MFLISLEAKYFEPLHDGNVYVNDKQELVVTNRANGTFYILAMFSNQIMLSKKLEVEPGIAEPPQFEVESLPDIYVNSK
jgi:hypothetical protein